MWRQLSPLILKVYLLIILRVLKQTVYSQKDNQLAKVFTRDFKPTDIAKILNQSNPKESTSEETQNLQDEIVSIVLLILVENYLKLKQQSSKTEHIEFISPATRVADSERKELMSVITHELNANQSLRDNSYFTLMLIAFDKGRVHELSFSAIPKIDEIITIIKNTRLRQETGSRNAATTFDIDFFFIVLEQFRKYHLLTKRIFLTHLHNFLRNHQPAFMAIFEEIQTVENTFRRKLLGFFFMIISECITSTDREISRFAENILLEVCYFQLTSNPLEQSQLDPFIKDKMNSFIQEKDKKQAPAITNTIGSSDYDKLKLLTQIFMFFKNDNNQFQILIRLLHRIYKETP